MQWIIEEAYPEDGAFNATNKARQDIVTISKRIGFQSLRVVAPFYRPKSKVEKLKKPFIRLVALRAWKKALKKPQEGDIILLQIPLMHYVTSITSILETVKKKGVKIVAILHDLELIRNAEDIAEVNLKTGSNARTIRLLQCCDKIIVHNPSMKDFITKYLGIDEKRIVVLGIFDYVMTDQEIQQQTNNSVGGIVFAGNLSKTKSAFLYELPEEPDYELYGTNYTSEDSGTRNIHYHGKYPPEELPDVLSGKYALVWDGNSCETCSGTYGEYLRYNNPHKVSLYLSAGLPLVIWEEAALADFVQDYRCGITIRSIVHLQDLIDGIDNDQYQNMREAAINVGRKIRTGYFTETAIHKCLSDL